MFEQINSGKNWMSQCKFTNEANAPSQQEYSEIVSSKVYCHNIALDVFYSTCICNTVCNFYQLTEVQDMISHLGDAVVRRSKPAFPDLYPEISETVQDEHTMSYS